MNVTPAPVERPYDISFDQLGDLQCNRVRQAEPTMPGFQCCGVVSNGLADGHGLAAGHEVSSGRQRLAANASRPNEDLCPRRGGEHELVIIRVGERIHRRVMVRVIDRERGDHNACIENDQSRHWARRSSR